MFEPSANTFVVPLDLLEFAEADSDSVAVKLLLAPACCMLLFDVENVFELTSVVELSLLYVASSVVE